MLLVIVCLAGAAGAKEDPAPDEQTEELSEEERRGLEALETETVLIKAKRLSLEEETTAFAEVLEVKREATRMVTVNQVLDEAVGVQVRSLGGLGSYGAASIRGSTPNQVPVYLDGILLNAGGFDAVDLGGLSLDMLGQIQVFRGSTPASLGTAGIGGAISLKSRAIDQPLTELALSAGWWSTYRLFGLRADHFQAGDTRSLLVLSLSGSRGNFLYLNDTGTEYNPDDDRIAERANNRHFSPAGLFKLDTRISDWRLSLLAMASGKDRGVPGLDSPAALQAHLNTARVLGSLRAKRVFDPGLGLALELSYLHQSSEFQDTLGPGGELGLGRQHDRTQSRAAAAGIKFEAQPSLNHYTTARLDLRFERLSIDDLLRDSEGSPKDRLRIGLAAQHEWQLHPSLAILPSARLSWLDDRFGGGPVPGSVLDRPASQNDDLHWEASLGARWQIASDWSMQANGGRYVRTPTLGEMFGDQGAVVGNPELEAEAGINADLGLIWLAKGFGPLSDLRLELAGFGNWSEDLIAYWQNSQSTIKAGNIDAARVLGIELSTRLRLWRWLGLAGNYTFLHTRNRADNPVYAGKQLPGKPIHSVYGRLACSPTGPGWLAEIWLGANYTAGNMLDPANLKDAGARLLLDLGLRLQLPSQGLTMTLEMKNLLDEIRVDTSAGIRRPIQDFEGFPLPGRTFLLSLHWQLGGQDEQG